MEEMDGATNIQVNITDDGILTLRIDLNKSGSRSYSGKSDVLASTHGNKEISHNIYLGLNCYRKVGGRRG